MEHGFGGGPGGLRFYRRFKAKPVKDSFSPSFGVRHGFIANPNWPPPPGVEEATERRGAARVPLTFQLGVGKGQRVQVNGNVSAGGAMFLLQQPLQATQVDIYVKLPDAPETHVVGELIATHGDNGSVAHRIRWTEPARFAATAEQLVRRPAQA